jgi:hypothetical protein
MRMKSPQALVVCLLGTLLCSCGAKARISFVPKGAASYEARQGPCGIQVFQDSKPDRPYVEIGTINYHHERHRTSAGALKLDTALPQIRRRACEIGADAIVNIRVTDEKRLEWAMFHVTATAVRFQEK